jgi:hypothetical protein
MAQNIQTFAGDVVVPGTLKANLVTIEDPILTLGSNNYVDKASNTGFIINRFDSNANVAFYFDETNEQLRLAYTASVGTDKNIVVDENTDLEINVFGYVSAYGFRGDGGLLSNLVTDLQSVTEYGASSDQTLVLSNVTTAIDATQGNVVVAGNVTASTFFGDGANLTGIAATLEEIIINGNVTSNTMELQNATSLITTGKVGIANSAPQHDLSVGANLYVEDVGSNVLTVEGNISAHQLTLGTIEITPGYGLENVTNISNISYQTLILSNAQTAFVSTAKAGIGIEPDAADVGAAGLHVDGHLRLGGAADNTDEEVMDIKAAGALNVLANESDTDNTNTGLLLRAGGLNESNITMYGDLSTADKQYMSFATRSEERMRIHGDGNVSIGHTAGNYMLDVAGDANCVSLSIQDLTINTIGIAVTYDIDNILENGNVTTNVLTVGKVTVTDPTLAQTASNLVTWNPTTSEFEDSGGLISNKLAIVSEQPPSALTANSTTVTNHGVYKVTTSGLATDSNAWNAFDDDTAVAWTSVDIYKGTSNVYDGVVQLSSDTSTGEWLAVELPYKATLRYVKLTPSAVASYPTDADLYATNDNISWDLLKEWTGVVPASASEEQTVFVNASDAYKRYAIVTTKVAGDSITASLAEWKLFCESFTVDGGKVKLASSTITGGNTVVDQTGPHARGPVPLRKYPEIVFTEGEFEGNDSTKTYTQGGYTVSANSFLGVDYKPWKAFNQVFIYGDDWISAVSYSGSTPYNATSVDSFNGVNGSYLSIKLPKNIKLSYTLIYGRNLEYIDAGVLYARKENTSNWVNLKTISSSEKILRLDVDSQDYYEEFLIHATSVTHPYGYAAINEWELYGYEETSDPDTSVDTKITSQFNLPDTTGVKLYIDGDKGSTATDLSGEGHTLADDSESFSGNAWSFSSLSTSNVTMTSGDLAMEGDHPHSVSLWFNAANVSSNATLFHVGTAAGEGDAKTSISLTESGHLGWIDGGDNQFLSANTWHNLVYATQGGGGVRTCYLDGRKLGDVSVQDTFGDYPPFAMTGYSQGGYTVSASSDLTNWDAYQAFNNDLVHGSNTWITDNSMYNTGGVGTPTNNADTTVVDATQEDGEWLQIELPHPLKVSYMDIAPQGQNTGTLDRAPKDGIIAGSQDGTTWETMKSWTDVTDWELTGTSGVYKTFIMDTNTNKAYKYIRIIITKTGGTDAYGAIGDVKIFGHKENDTTRFPVSSTVLKYPHIAMTGPAQRGYVASASREPTTYSAPAWHAFDGGTSLWATLGGAYDRQTGAWNSSVTMSTTVDGTPENGDWIQIEFPRKIIVTKMRYQPDQAVRAPGYGILAVSNDGTTWTALYNISNATYTDGVFADFTISNTTAYKYYRLIASSLYTNNVFNANRNRFTTKELEFYGTEEDLDVVARVGEGLDGKVANFRVYDKYLHEEQALELWDAQKDQFGRAESSVSVYRGHVGIGTTTPSAALTVMDEAEEMEEFPPRAMTGYKTYMEGHGVFKASASSTWSNNLYEAFGAFNKTLLAGTPDLTWNSVAGGFSSGSDYAYTGTNSLGGISGEWLKLSTPYAINPSTIKITVASSFITNYAPEDFYLLGSVDDATWYVLAQETGETWSSLSHTSSINTTNTYKYFALVVTKTRGADNTNVAEMRVFGTRERGQSTLHDGQLTLTKNLTVPRIGPALDADDTPRRDRLVVEYNTSTNPTANGTVKDTSGRGLDGLMVGVTYDSTEKAFVSTAQDGSQWIETKIPQNGSRLSDGFSGTIWVNHEYFDTTTKNSFVWTVGDRSGTGNNREFGLTYNAVGQTLKSYYATFNGGSGNLNLFHTSQTPFGTWTHVGITYDGTTVKLYINGVFSVSSTLTDVNISDNNCVVRLNGDVVSANSTHQGTPMSLSNFKLYDVALTADEVKRLYDMGRSDEGHHVVNFSKTRVGIGLGDGEAPRAQLDVRGIVHANGGQSWPIPTAVFSNVTPSNVGGAYYSRNIGTQWVYYNTVMYEDDSGTILSPALNSRDITLTRPGIYEFSTRSSLRLQASVSVSHIGLYIRNISGSVTLFENDGYEIINDLTTAPTHAEKTHRILVREVPTTVGYYMQPNSNRTDQFFETAYGSNGEIHLVMIKYLG